MTKPFLKWVGGKRQLLDEILPRVPDNFDTYYEPFIGGGAVFFALEPSKAVISDINSELINAYTVLRDDCHKLIKELDKYDNTEEMYYAVRELDRDHKNYYNTTTPLERAARFIYLNKTCFNGLYRENKKGQFNVPYGKREFVTISDESTLVSCADDLISSNTQIVTSDFGIITKSKPGDFVYLDPPYIPLSVTSSFTSYSKSGFGMMDQIRLRDICIDLDNRGVKWMLSNSSADAVYSLYTGFNIDEVDAKRKVSASVSGRRKVKEVLIRNYK